MRVSTLQMSMNALGEMLNKQAELVKVQQQVATGKKNLKPSDDPVLSATVLTVKQSMEVVERYQVNANLTSSRLSLEETGIEGASKIMQRVRELTVQGNSSVLSTSDRKTLAIEMRELLNSLVQQANSKDSYGDYLFSGHQGKTIPVTRNGAGEYLYQGDDGQRLQQIGSTQRSADSDPASKLFFNIPEGNGHFKVTGDSGNTGEAHFSNSALTDQGAYAKHSYRIDFTVTPTGTTQYSVTDTVSSAQVTAATDYTPGQEISFAGGSVTFKGEPAAGDSFTIEPSRRQSTFQTIQNIVDALESDTTAPADQARLFTAMGNGLQELDLSMDNLSNVRAEVGARMNTIDRNKEVNADMLIQLEKILSNTESIDLTKAISDLNLKKTALEATQLAYLKLQDMSLYDRIS